MASWNLTGNYAETCSCSVPCPCNFLNAPTEGDCTAWAAWHIEDGSFDGTPLGGLNVALALNSPGHMLETKWRVAMYVDERADDAQREALQQIFGGEAGGLFGELKGFIGEVAGVRSAAIEFRNTGGSRRFNIEGAGSADIEAVPGEGGQEVRIDNAPLSLSPGQPLTVGKAAAVSLSDHGITLGKAGVNAFFAPFSYTSG